jgi:uncharacterized protein YdaU (DUF1376 family)
MPSPVPYFNFYPSDYLSSPTVACMSVTCEGMYMRLLFFQWQDGGIPDDERKLRGLTKTIGAQNDCYWQEFAEHLDEVFPLCEDGLRRNRRMDADRIAAFDLVRRNSENGKKGGRPKNPELYEEKADANQEQSESKAIGFEELNSEKPPVNPPVSEGLPTANQSKSDPKANRASASASHIEKELSNESSKKSLSVADDPPWWELPDVPVPIRDATTILAKVPRFRKRLCDPNEVKAEMAAMARCLSKSRQKAFSDEKFVVLAEHCMNWFASKKNNVSGALSFETWIDREKPEGASPGGFRSPGGVPAPKKSALEMYREQRDAEESKKGLNGLGIDQSQIIEVAG